MPALALNDVSSVHTFPSTTPTDAMDDHGAMFRPGSSVAMLRPQRLSDQVGYVSWYEETPPKRLSCCQLVRRAFDSLLLLGVATSVVLAAYVPVNVEFNERQGGALPYLFAVFVALAGHEFSWLAYRVHLKLYMPLKLHEKQTSRELYRHIIAYVVDEETVAVTALADKVCCRSNMLAATVLSVLAAGVSVFLCTLPASTGMPLLYVGGSTFVGMLSAALAPNVSSAVCVLIRYGYFFLSSLKVMARINVETQAMESNDNVDTPNVLLAHLAAIAESSSLLLLSVCLLLIVRALTGKDAVESALMIVLDVAGILYLNGPAIVLGHFEQATRVRESGALAGFFVIVWSAELGAFVTVQFLKTVQFPWVHPLSKHVSSQQNVEKVLGAVTFAVGGAFLVSRYVDFDMPITFVALLSAGAVVCAHIGKLFLVSLKKIARLASTGSYLQVGGGVLDRLDTLLYMVLVFAPFFQRAVYNQAA